MATQADGHAERDASMLMLGTQWQFTAALQRTVGADKGYDSRDFVAVVRHLGVTPHAKPHAPGRQRDRWSDNAASPTWIGSSSSRVPPSTFCRCRNSWRARPDGDAGTRTTARSTVARRETLAPASLLARNAFIRKREVPRRPCRNAQRSGELLVNLGSAASPWPLEDPRGSRRRHARDRGRSIHVDSDGHLCNFNLLSGLAGTHRVTLVAAAPLSASVKAIEQAGNAAEPDREMVVAPQARFAEALIPLLPAPQRARAICRICPAPRASYVRLASRSTDCDGGD